MSAEVWTHPGRKSSLNSWGVLNVRPWAWSVQAMLVGVVLGHGLEVPAVEGLVTGAVRLDVAGCHGSSSCGRWPSVTRALWRPLVARTLPRLSPTFPYACRHEKDTRTVDPRSPDGRVDQGQDPAVRPLRRRHRRLPHRRRPARPQRAGPVRLPGPQPWPCVAPRRAADGRLGRGRPGGGGQRAERAAVQAAPQPGRRPSPGADRDRAAVAPGDLRRRRGGPGGRPPGGVRPSPRDGGRRHGARPGSPTTSPPGPSLPGWRRPGSTSGGAGWRRSGCAGWSALPPPASALAARRWPKPRNAPGC